MVQQPHRRLLTVLCVLLLAAGAFAGCMSKKSSPEDTSRALTVESPEYLRGLDYARRTSETPVPCNGCIDLRPPASSSHPAIERRAPTTDEWTRGLGVAIPLPAVGDNIWVEGAFRSSDHTEMGGFPIPSFDQRRFAYSLQLEGGPHDGAHVGHGFSPILPMVLRHSLSDLDFDGNTLHPSEQTLFVDTATRAATGMTVLGTSSDQPDAWFATFDPSAHQAATVTKTLPAATLALLGSHLWGATLREGDRYSFTWTPTGARDAMVWFDYTVEEARTPTAQPGEQPAPLPKATVKLEAHDVYGKQRAYELMFDGTSPYPGHVHMIYETHRATDRSLVPLPITTQTISHEAHGTGLVNWAAASNGTGQPLRSWGTDLYRIDERFGTPALDTLPAYPLADAIEDLQRLEESFRTWQLEHPAGVLIDAKLHPIRVYAQLGTPTELVWDLTFTADDTRAQAWTVARWDQPGSLAASPAHRSDTTSTAEIPRSVRSLNASAFGGSPLVGGNLLGDPLASFGDAPIDIVHYQLNVDARGVLGGFLKIGAQHMPAGTVENGRPGFYLVQNLATGAIETTFAFTEV